MIIRLLMYSAAVVLAAPGCGSNAPASKGLDAKIGMTGCSWVEPQPFEEVRDQTESLCDPGCVPIFARREQSGADAFVACVLESSLRDGAIQDAEVCLRSPVDLQEYIVNDFEPIDALTEVCWIPCSITGAEDESFDSWLSMIGTEWTDRCEEAWSGRPG